MQSIRAEARPIIGLAAVLLAIMLAGCSGPASTAEGLDGSGIEAPPPTGTAVAGRTTVGFNTRCTRAGAQAQLRVDYRAVATEAKRLVRVTIKLDDELVFDSGEIDQVQFAGSRNISLLPGTSTTVEVMAMPQDGRYAAGRKKVSCPGSPPGFRA